MKKLVILGLFLCSAGLAMAQCVNCPPPPSPRYDRGPGGSGNGNDGNGGDVPIDGGATMLVVLGLAYAGYKGKTLILK